MTAIYLGTGLYSVDFNANISQCAYIAQIGGPGTSAPEDGQALTYLRSGFTDQVRVDTTGEAGAEHTPIPQDRPFHLAVHC